MHQPDLSPVLCSLKTLHASFTQITRWDARPVNGRATRYEARLCGLTCRPHRWPLRHRRPVLERPGTRDRITPVIHTRYAVVWSDSLFAFGRVFFFWFALYIFVYGENVESKKTFFHMAAGEKANELYHRVPRVIHERSQRSDMRRSQV